jgi:hypothetical protein
MWRSGWMSLNKTTPMEWLVTGQNCSRRSRRSLPSTRTGLGHVDDLSEFNCPVAGKRRFCSKQFGCNPQRLYFLFDSQYVLLFQSENFKRILHGSGSFAKYQRRNRSGYRLYDCGLERNSIVLPECVPVNGELSQLTQPAQPSRLFHSNRLPPQNRPVQVCDRLLGFEVVGHFHNREPA